MTAKSDSHPGTNTMNVHTAVRSDKAERLARAREEAYSTPLKDFHPGAPRLFQDDTLWPWFERLRKEEPVHYCTNAPIEPYWSVTRYNVRSPGRGTEISAAAPGRPARPA